MIAMTQSPACQSVTPKPEVGDRPAGSRPWYSSLRFWCGVVISLISFYLVTRQVDWHGMAEVIRQSRWQWLLLGMGLTLVTYGLFAFRLRTLLSHVVSLPISEAFSYVMLGYFANTVLPLRLGDVAQASLLAYRLRVSPSLVLAGLTLGRILDVIWMLTLALALLPTIVLIPAIRYAALAFAAATAVALSGMLIFAARSPGRILVLVGRLNSLPKTIQQRLMALLIGFHQGLKVLLDRRQLLQVLSISAVGWLCAGFWTICYLHGFRLQIPWYAGWLLLVVVNLGAALPSSPGFVGLYHYLVWLALSLWVPDRSRVLGYAIASHGLNTAMILSVGGVCLWREGFTIRGLAGRGRIART